MSSGPKNISENVKPLTNLSEGVRICTGKYILTKLIGRGGFGEVWAADEVHRETGEVTREVVLKILKVVDSDDPYILKKSFVSELKLTKGLKHPNIVEVYDAGEDRGHAWIAMEKLDGVPGFSDLESVLIFYRIHQLHLPEDFCVAVLYSICEALNYAHERKSSKGKLRNRKVYHRDIKPKNLFLTYSAYGSRYETGVKILDFGISKIEDEIVSDEQTKHTELIDGCHTTQYSCPELWEGERGSKRYVGKKYNEEHDVYSAGLVFYEMLNNTRVFTAENHPATENYIIPKLGVHVRNKKLRDLAHSLINKNPKKRFKTAGKVLEYIDGIYNNEFHSKRELVQGVAKICRDKEAIQEAETKTNYSSTSFNGNQNSKSSNENLILKQSIAVVAVLALTTGFLYFSNFFKQNDRHPASVENVSVEEDHKGLDYDSCQAFCKSLIDKHFDRNVADGGASRTVENTNPNMMNLTQDKELLDLKLLSKVYNLKREFLDIDIKNLTDENIYNKNFIRNDYRKACFNRDGSICYYLFLLSDNSQALVDEYRDQSDNVSSFEDVLRSKNDDIISNPFVVDGNVDMIIKNRENLINAIEKNITSSWLNRVKIVDSNVQFIGSDKFELTKQTCQKIGDYRFLRQMKFDRKLITDGDYRQSFRYKNLNCKYLRTGIDHVSIELTTSKNK